ncbi:MAG: hypothetical protein GEU97_21215 [Actinophytocola sp.]|nr:hypothetical protein [Actinophytocola sp.]
MAVNPVQGCPKSCEYCFLNERGQTAVKPERLVSPAVTVRMLLESAFYEPSRPVALYTWTDVMAVPSSRQHLAELLDELVRRRVSNPIVVITKCHVPDDTITAIASARARGSRVVVYLSYSGLDRDIERGIRHDALRDNFPRLSAAGVPLVHYWRPAFPESATAATMERVLDWAARYARCTVAAGLKVERAGLPRLAKRWPQLASTDGVTEAEGVYPRAFWEFIHRTWQRHPGYPVFHTNSCALAYVLDEPDSFGIYGSTTCRLRNVCPIAQRDRCHRADTERQAPTPEAIRETLARRGLGDVEFQISADSRELVVDAVAATNVIAALTRDLGVRVRARRDESDGYWNSGTIGTSPLILD